MSDKKVAEAAEPQKGYTYEKDLKYGMHGEDVKALQTALTAKGYRCTPSGIYDMETVKAVRKLQQANQLPQNGIFGKTDAKALLG